MWSLEARSEFTRVGAAAAYLVAVALLVVLQELGVRLRREEQRAWWAGNGRDVLNAVGFAAVTAALRGYGFPLPAALVSGASLTLALFGTTVFLEGRDHIVRQRSWALAAGLALAVPVLLFAGPLLAALGRLAARLFPLAG
jgi:hypothetical protein